jgi:hypothetical protein
MGRVSVLAVALVSFAGCATLGSGVSDDGDSPWTYVTVNPDEAKLITSDIANFWYAFDTATPENDDRVFREEYLRRGTDGLKEFSRLKIDNLRGFIRSISRHSNYYSSIRTSSLALLSEESNIRSAYHRLKAVYPEAMFPPVYFLIGAMNTGGVTTKRGIVIGAELYTKTPSSPLDELNVWEQSVVGPVEKMPLIVAHELVHFQQHFAKSPTNLLERSLIEGGADFIAELITGSLVNEPQHQYGNLHERELWNEFRAVMYGRDFSGWLYNGAAFMASGAYLERPVDLGYFIGYKICQSYYQRAPDKTKAIRDILVIQDFNQFFKASGYGATVVASK